MPSALDGEVRQTYFRHQLQEAQETQRRREEREARRVEKETLRLNNIAVQRKLTLNAAIRKLAEAARQVHSLQAEELPLFDEIRPVLQRLLDDITPPTLSPVQNLPDDDEEDALR